MTDPQFTNKQVAIIGGPTSTGKTSLALELAQLFPADLVSADSRQVYRGLDIIPGKDIPPNFLSQSSNLKFHGQKVTKYTDGTTSIWGYDLIKPGQDWNVSFFHDFAWKIIKHIWKQNRLPIIVGGTGLYLQSLYQDLPEIHIPNNSKLRDLLETKSVGELQAALVQKDNPRYQKMNNSDRHNPRRLIRAIEISSYNKNNPIPKQSHPTADFLKIGLQAPLPLIEARIKDRIKARLNQNYTPEVEYLQSFNLQWHMPASTIIGFQELVQHRQGLFPLSQATKLWATREIDYAKRQLTWFRAQPGFKWFDTSDKNYQDKGLPTGKAGLPTGRQVVDLVTTWYTNS